MGEGFAKLLRLTFELEETQPGKYKVDLKMWIPRPKRENVTREM